MEGRLICYAWYEKNVVDFFPKAMVEQAQDRRTKRRAEIKKMNLQEIYDEQRGVIEIVSQPKPKAEIIHLPVPEPIKIDREKLAAEMNKQKEFDIPHNEKDRYRLWQDLDRRLQGGEAMEERAVRFYESFRTSTTYKAFTEVEAQLSIKQQ